MDPTGAGPPGLPERYEDLGRIGRGGMGEVRRVRDTSLGRTLAMKIVHPRLLGDAASIARFLAEARANAQLQHPNIVPVHDVGRLDDGRVWFTMKEVRGRTLSEVIAEVHAASVERWAPSASGWTFRRLVTAFHAICQAVAYAHERGVVHRDLKPDNAMVGVHGEVYVLDYGALVYDSDARGRGARIGASTRPGHGMRASDFAGSTASEWGCDGNPR